MRFGASAAAILLVLGLAARIPVFAQAGPTLEPVHPFEVASLRQGTSRDPLLSLVSLGYAMPLFRIEGLQFQAKLIFERRGDGWSSAPPLSSTGSRRQAKTEVTIVKFQVTTDN